jgi:hypothetical protein
VTVYQNYTHPFQQNLVVADSRETWHASLGGYHWKRDEDLGGCLLWESQSELRPVTDLVRFPSRIVFSLVLYLVLTLAGVDMALALFVRQLTGTFEWQFRHGHGCSEVATLLLGS